MIIAFNSPGKSARPQQEWGKLMLKRINKTRAWIVLIVSILLAGTLFAPVASQALTREARNKGLLAAVKILIIDADLRVFGTCTGTYLGEGVIVTNWHCVGHTDLYGPDDTGLGLQHGDTYHPDGVVAIAPQTDPRQLPKPTYFARVQSGEPDLDIAVVKIFRMIDPKAQLPANIPIPAMGLANSDLVDIADPVYIFGYPAAGGELITFTGGEISGFEDQTGDGEVDSFKTDAPISPGNSGGLATNDDGDQIGIPTFATRADAGQGLGGIRFINLAVPYINQVIDIGDATPQPLPTGTIRPPTPQPTPSGNTNFGPITFGTEIEGNQLAGVGTEFDSGTEQIIAVFAYKNMRNGTKWGAVWKLNGQVAIDQRNDGVWDDGATGTTGVSINLDGGLPDGEYELELYVNNNLAQSGAFTIGDGSSPTPEPPPVNPGGEGVTLQGQIVDADTEEGIANAAILILKPGTTLDDISQDNLQSLTVAAALTDGEGFYITAPPIPAGDTYTVVVLANGYQARGFEDGLEISDDSPDLVNIDPIPLSKR
jgi:hypothetical protein